MALGTINVHIRIKHLWLLKAINVPLMLLNLKPYVPQFCVAIETQFKDVESK